jgi:hypothetical protein
VRYVIYIYIYIYIYDISRLRDKWWSHTFILRQSFMICSRMTFTFNFTF